jgi:hypothetical protein
MGESKKGKLVSRRDFLAAGGAVIAAGALSACSPSTVTDTVTNTVTNTATTTKTATVTGAATTVTSTTQAAAKYATMNPRGFPKEVDIVPLVPRIAAADLKNVSIWVIGQKGKGQGVLTGIASTMKTMGYKITEDGKTAFFGSDEPALWNRAAADAKAIIFGVGD